MPEQHPQPLNETEQSVFDEIAYGFGDISLEAQRGILEDLNSRQYQHWQDSGILRKLVDYMPIRQGERHIGLGVEHILDSSSALMHRYVCLDVDYKLPSGDRNRIWLSRIRAATIKDGRLTPNGSFDANDAKLLLEHLTQRKHLKDVGILPAMSVELNKVVDFSYSA